MGKARNNYELRKANYDLKTLNKQSKIVNPYTLTHIPKILVCGQGENEQPCAKPTHQRFWCAGKSAGYSQQGVGVNLKSKIVNPPFVPPLAKGGMGGFGIAFDIGTTTIVGSLINLETFKDIGTDSTPNPQSRFGKDILSRIKCIMENASNLDILQQDVISACNSIINSIVRQSPVLSKEDIALIVAVGNSVMEHIFLGISPTSLAKVPYRPVFKDARELSVKDIGLDISSAAKVYAFPLIGGFVGGDTVGVILSTNIHKIKGYALAIDIGTNSEIVLSSKGSLYATSAAAGPAFEGGSIKHGMIAKKGAIQGIGIKNDKLLLDVIGDTTPEGICGSGIIDAIAKLLDIGIIDTTGRIKNRNEVEGNIANRIIEEGQGSGVRGQGNEFVLYKDAKKEITVTQNDVRELQLAKSAIQAGIKLLLKKAKSNTDEIEKVFIAGAFGSNINKDSLAKIGVLEKAWIDKVIFVGDAALDGAKLALCSEEKRKEAEDIAKQTKHLSLSGSAHFQEEFMKGMGFPERSRQ
ncbi:MAG TPA: metal-binding protein [Deltaproteobacteria bacterium]|nr:MAG: hypothetical protein A2056_01615 [Deltaproteobacteria bacterium GWA2_42_85]OGP44597.1 MAG: hypothetical protein A2090_10960 [Deltaproteobacteria bacterium GWD2_42_10]OGP46207.1 MAG: hypothetical protein A2022_02505 [Deltaproteobacteria bacterium GWF2_42_12]OGQ26547.1 MAG: hypothetical protein A3D29_07775 [Deltaproteobacteria bacterium RIFCSPHIGHO2_02_FULL_42_44]OGQ35395.1 MAG: hypothetical protein A3H47_08345 [Deltaproteobacteria bacterium RIFCSPLOWO2_02_FULL_42_39]OGQ66496.1 MAG: hypo